MSPVRLPAQLPQPSPVTHFEGMIEVIRALYYCHDVLGIEDAASLVAASGELNESRQWGLPHSVRFALASFIAGSR